MKSLFKNSFFLFFVTLASMQGQTSINGDITLNTTWEANKSPFNLTGSINIKNGAKLTIENGVTVNMNSNSINIGGDNWGTPYNGILDASGVTFNSGKIYFNQESSGSLSNCGFQNTTVYFYNTSNPLFTNNSLDASSSLHFKSTNAFERISGNTYGSQKIYLSLNVGKNLTIKKIQNADYYFEGELKIGNGSKLTIENGVNIFLQSNSLSVGGDNWGTPYNGILDASGVTFNGGKIYFNQESSGTVTSCIFQNTPIYFNDKTNPQFANNTLDPSSLLYFRSIYALERVDGNTYGNSKLYIKLSVGKNFTLKRIASIDYYCDGNIEIGNGSTLTIESGVNIFLQSNSINVGGDNWGTPYNGNLNASGVTFNGGKINYNQESSGKLASCSFQNTPISISNNADLIVSNSNVDLFSKIDNKSSKNVDARNNFWGDATGPKHSTNPSGYGTTISDKVDYIPFATKEFDITTSVERIGESLPTAFLLSQNYPNPFNPTTTINYTLPFSTKIKLELFDLTGRLVAVLSNQEQSAGVYQVKFDGSFLSSGVYYYRLQTPKFSETKKMLLIK